MKHIELKRVEGAERNAEWAKLSDVQKIASLDARLGKGVGAKRQRMLLAAAGAKGGK